MSERPPLLAARPPLLATGLPLLAVLGSAAVAVLVFARTLDGGFLSDDMLLAALGTERSDGSDVDWGAVLADFGRPWLGLDVPFYRPLLTVSFAIDQALGGGAAWPFHVTNVLLHAVVAAAAAALAALLCPRRPTAAAWIAGLCVAVHPVAVEPVAWIAARNSELEVFFRTLAMVAFARHLRTRSRGTEIAAVVLAVCAFATKESAVMLPVSLLAVDLLDAPRRPWRARVRLHLPFALLVVGYFALRLAVLGAVLGASGEGTMPGSALARAGGKLAAVLHGGTILTAPLLGFVLAAGIARARATLAIGAGWLVLHTAPTWQLTVGDALGGSRMVYGALPALGVVVALLLVRGMPVFRGAPLLAVGTWAMLVLPTSERLDAYAAAWRDMDAAMAGIRSLEERAAPGRPLAIAAMPVNAPGIPPCNPNAWFPFAERPHQPRDVPVVSLGYVTVAVPLAEALFRDASPIHALLDHGCAVATWHASGFLVRQRTAPAALPTLERDPSGPATFRFELPLPPADGFEALTVVVASGRPVGARVTWQTAGPELPPELAGIDVGGGVPDGDGARIEVDLTHHLALPSLATLGVPLTGVTIELAGPGRVAGVVLHARVPGLAVAEPPLAGRRFALASFASRTAPAGVTPGATLRLVLQGPHGAIPVTCEPAAPIRVPEPVQREFASFARLARQDRILFWFEALSPPGQPGFGRSAVDWFELAPDGG